REPEAPADLLQRLRLGVVEAVPQDQDLPLPLRQRQQCGRQRLRAQRDLDLLLRQRIVTGDEVAEDRILLLTNRLVEARRGPGGRTHLVCLLDRQRRLLGDLLERRL